MARKVLNRRELRRESDAAEARTDEDTTEAGEEGAVAAPTKKAKVPAKRKSRAAAKEIRKKAFWGVFNQSLKRVQLFEYSDRKGADEKAAELTVSQKSPHFVMPVKEEIETK